MFDQVTLIEEGAVNWLAIIFSSCALALGLASAVWAARRARRRIPVLEQPDSMNMLEVRDLVQVVMDRSLVGLCLLRKSDGEVLIQNELSGELITVDVEYEGRRWGLRDYFLMLFDKEVTATDLLEIDAKRPGTGCSVRILAHLVEVKYHHEPALFCSFGDDNKRRNAELMLASAKDAADEASLAKSTFLAMMSHEIRTPLYGVLGTLELLANTTLLPQQRGYLSTIEHSSSNLLNIIDDILDFSRIEANQLTLEFAPFNLVELAEGVARSFVSLAQKKGVALYCCLQPDLPLLTGDRNRLQQVLSNLLSNAVKFTDSGKIVIRIEGTENTAGQLDVRIQVSDSGIGIRNTLQAKLFEPFIQADNSTARRFGGTGLGLSICRKLMELMGGKIELVSELGLGSSFTLLLELAIAEKLQPTSLAGLPIVHVSAGANEQLETLLALVKHADGQAQLLTETLPDSAHHDLLLVTWPHRPETALDNRFAGIVWLEPQGAPTPEWHEDGWHVSSMCQHGILQALQRAARKEPGGVRASPVLVPAVLKTLHVLAVEDHPINQLVLTEQLQQLGYQVTMVSDGREALQRWHRGEHFDIVVTDVNMPELDGYQLTRRLRAEGVNVPIVGVTANAQTEEGERCLQAGMDDYLVKPVSLAALREALQAVGVSIAGGSKANVMAKLDEIKPAMRDLFVSTTRHDWAAMMNSLSEGNATAVTQYAHRIKGALVTIGAMDAAEFCSHLEEIAASGHLSRVDPCLGRLKEYLDPILEASS
ncbi:hybrid sensor histidine kinase/response regulator [Pseudomonas gessardii]|uniref:Sensory/regulatory protein RpfC n=3 Tax=Pseudomonas gessardii TaxID=78544 RepID=A0A7Y1QLS7_9PSED|nr:hybrid sensor histidine kinase/response regulator [Pseudomonas gessardii]MRU48954.1 response regulator [Pseudomonas gessardii]NNA96109.1 response regulator [Pseudomonas gessardii]ONH49336.1 hypothetical protein BLL38_01325 [Pseudomonas gessardii]